MANEHVTIQNEQGENINISVLGTFSIPDLNKEYMMYSMVDENEENSLGAVLLGEIIRDEDKLQVVGIPEEEKEMVVAYYNEVSEQMGGE